MNRNYIKHLREQVTRIKGMTKGERTSNRIKIATAELLNKMSYKDLRVADICHQSGISAGTFYIYYKHKKEVTVEVLNNFAEIYHHKISMHRNEDIFEKIQTDNLEYFKLAKDNPGLMSCFLEVGIEDSEVAAFHQAANLKSYKNIVANVIRNKPDANYDLTLAMVSALGSMMDEVVRRLVLEETPFLTDVLENLHADEESYCECLSIIWYRTLFGVNPKTVKSKMARDFLEI